MSRRWCRVLSLLAVVLPLAVGDGEWWRMERGALPPEEVEVFQAGLCELPADDILADAVTTEAWTPPNPGLNALDAWTDDPAWAPATALTHGGFGRTSGFDAVFQYLVETLVGAPGMASVALSGGAPGVGRRVVASGRSAVGQSDAVPVGNGLPVLVVEAVPGLMTDALPAFTLGPVMEETSSPVPVPEPATWALLAAALLALAGARLSRSPAWLPDPRSPSPRSPTGPRR